MRVKSHLKSSVREKFFNNEILLNNNHGIVSRKFSREELKKYNKKFDEELEKKKISWGD